jgi:hypothetical protein
MASVQDNFDRADENPIGAPWLNGWGTGPNRIAGNGFASPSTSGQLGVSIYGSAGLSPNQTVRARVGVKNDFEEIHVIARGSVANGGGGYIAIYQPQTDQVYLHRRVAGISVSFNGGASIGARDVPVGDWLELRAENVGADTRLRVYHYDGTTWVQIGADFIDSDASDVETGDPGLAVNDQNGNATRISEFYAIDDLGASPSISGITQVRHGETVTATISAAGSVAADRQIHLRVGATLIEQTETSGNATSLSFTALAERVAPLTTLPRGLVFLRVTRTSDSQFGELVVTLASPAGQQYVNLVPPLVDEQYRIQTSPALDGTEQVWAAGDAGFTTAVPAGHSINVDGSITVPLAGDPVPFYARALDLTTFLLGTAQLQQFADTAQVIANIDGPNAVIAVHNGVDVGVVIADISGPEMVAALTNAGSTAGAVIANIDGPDAIWTIEVPVPIVGADVLADIGEVRLKADEMTPTLYPLPQRIFTA